MTLDIPAVMILIGFAACIAFGIYNWVHAHKHV
jgi:hypothetical protein